MTTIHLVREEPASFFGMLGSHPTMLALYDAVRRAARLDAPVVVCGPTGSGKELVARALHALSEARNGPFCAVNVAALPDGLVESELFGSIRGAFTGAVSDRRGLIESAAHGTLFLDEAGELPRHTQPKLLRALEYGELRRVGATTTKLQHFRLVVTTQEEPATVVRAGRWREDFYYRIAGVLLRVPPLCERRSDIPALVNAFVAGRNLPQVNSTALALLAEQPWPGNVRDLQNTLVRAAFFSLSSVITESAVRAALADQATEPASVEGQSLRAARRQHVRETVHACGGDTRRAATLLRISRSQVYRILRTLAPAR